MERLGQGNVDVLPARPAGSLDGVVTVAEVGRVDVDAGRRAKY